MLAPVLGIEVDCTAGTALGGIYREVSEIVQSNGLRREMLRSTSESPPPQRKFLFLVPPVLMSPVDVMQDNTTDYTEIVMTRTRLRDLVGYRRMG